MTEPGDDPRREERTGGAGTTPEEPMEDFGAGKGPAEADSPGDPTVEPEAGGYAGRDPKTEMPRMPSVPETQDDSRDQSHDGAPPQDSEPPGSH